MLFDETDQGGNSERLENENVINTGEVNNEGKMMMTLSVKYI